MNHSKIFCDLSPTVMEIKINKWDLIKLRFPGKNTGVGCHSLFQGIFSPHGSNLTLPYCREILYHLSYQGIPGNYLESSLKAFVQQRNL